MERELKNFWGYSLAFGNCFLGQFHSLEECRKLYQWDHIWEQKFPSSTPLRKKGKPNVSKQNRKNRKDHSPLFRVRF